MKRTALVWKWVLWTAVVLCLLLMALAAYQLYHMDQEYEQENRVYEQLQALRPATMAEPLQHTTQPAAASADASQLTASPRPHEVEQALPSDPSSAETLDSQKAAFAQLEAINPDVVGWITLPGSPVDYPVVQGEDNEYYLKHLFDHTAGKAGCIFMSATNAPDFSDRNTILFGHHMKDGSMFGTLERYKQQPYFNQHPTMTLQSPIGTSQVHWFSGYVKTVGTLPTAFESDEAFLTYVAHLRDISVFQADVAVTATDRLLTLCTCSYWIPDSRFILVGVIAADGSAVQ